MPASWKGTKVCVTGGCSFLGSHLVESLVSRGASVRVVDNLSSGKRENLEHLFKTGTVPLVVGDLRDRRVAQDAMMGRDVVFHLAADHGGRGYVDRHQADCATNFALDGIVFQACADAKVKQVTFASSGCVYDLGWQDDPKQDILLTEDKVGPPYWPDGSYGMAKLCGEITLRAFYQDWGLKCSSVRIFTAYGERGKEDHAVHAMLARAHIRQNPFEVWGDGSAIRNWTHWSDVVSGLILAAERIHDGSAVNIGTTERIRVSDAARMACGCFGYAPTFKFLPEMPVGPLNRVCDNTLAKDLLGWEPQVPFAQGLQRTAEWYAETHDRDTVELSLSERLLPK